MPPHKQIYEIIRQHITDGIFKEGDLLPSENDLVKTHGFTRPTVRKALERLQSEGYIAKHQGKGSIVKGAIKGIGILSLKGTTSAVGHDNLQTRIIVTPEIRPLETAFLYSLSNTERESGSIYFERLRIMNGKAVFFDITILPNINLPRFTRRSLENKSLFDILRKHYQVVITGGEQQILAIKADARLREHFQVPEGHPVVQLNRKIETNRFGFYIYSQVFCNTEEYALYGTF